MDGFCRDIVHHNAIYGDDGTAGLRVRRGGGNLEDKVGARDADASPVLNVTIGRTSRTTLALNTSGQLLLQGHGNAGGDARKNEKNSRNDEPNTPIAGNVLPKKSSRGPIAGKLSLPKINTDGNFQDLLSDFESAERNWLSQDSTLPETAEEIAERYSIHYEQMDQSVRQILRRV